MKKNNFIIKNLKGLVFNPIVNEWIFLSNSVKVNYFCTYSLSN